MASQPAALLQTDLLELRAMVLDMELKTQQALSAELAALAGSDPNPKNIAALAATQNAIRQLQEEKALRLAQQRPKNT